MDNSVIAWRMGIHYTDWVVKCGWRDSNPQGCYPLTEAAQPTPRAGACASFATSAWWT